MTTKLRPDARAIFEVGQKVRWSHTDGSTYTGKIEIVEADRIYVKVTETMYMWIHFFEDNSNGN